MTNSLLEKYSRRVQALSAYRWEGRIKQVVGQVIESEGPYCSAGDCCEVISSQGRVFPGEIVGFRGSTVLSMTFEKPEHVRYGDRIVSWGSRPRVRVGDGMLGRVVDAFGNAADFGLPWLGDDAREIEPEAPEPFDRPLIQESIGSGIRAIDGFITCGRGQRLGVFGGSGVGKSTLLGMMVRNTNADVTILALIGERGREVREFLEHSLGEEGRRRSVVVVSTSDQTPLLRVRGAMVATSIAEHFAAQGKDVLLFMDSLTRLAMAQREISLLAGEPPTSKGYTPSVFSMMARLIERAGRFEKGSITGFYTVLMEGDDQQDPIVDGARALLDGHIVLDRKLAMKNHYPPISILDSISRLMPAVSSPQHLEKASALRKLLAVYRDAEDLVRIGAYQKGNDSLLDTALAVLPEINAFLQQRPEEIAPFAQSVSKLLQIRVPS